MFFFFFTCVFMIFLRPEHYYVPFSSFIFLSLPRPSASHPFFALGSWRQGVRGTGTFIGQCSCLPPAPFVVVEEPNLNLFWRNTWTSDMVSDEAHRPALHLLSSHGPFSLHMCPMVTDHQCHCQCPLQVFSCAQDTPSQHNTRNRWNTPLQNTR